MNREIAVSLVQARNRAGNPSFREVHDQLRDLIGDPCPSDEHIRRWHDPDKIPKGPLDPAVLAGLAEIYNVPLRDIDPDLESEVARRFEMFRRLLETAKRHTEGYEGPEEHPRVAPFLRPVSAA